ncbi:DDE-type integrase/transposase/recombinase [Nonomuraea sp. NPDC050451]|uniref:DDE-type integrase/transposase/recombinase n=1 Tax=Nonomuraea sp. NPDC050451 TaxID=3364364 RepID=UPI003796AF0B
MPVQVRAFTPATTEQGDFRGIPDLVRRDFTAERPGVKLVGDVTYIPTWEGFLYLATVIDCHSKAVVGWAVADHYRTELVAQAIHNAACTIAIEPDAIFHTDRGSSTPRPATRTCAGAWAWSSRWARSDARSTTRQPKHSTAPSRSNTSTATGSAPRPRPA